MKNIGILTFHRSYNYGAFMQCYSLSKRIAKDFPDSKVEVIDYCTRRMHENYPVSLIPFILGPKDKRNSGNQIVKQIGKYVLNPAILSNKRKLYSGFAEDSNTLPLSSFRIVSDEYDDLFHKIDNEYDILVVGSDAVWEFITYAFPNAYYPIYDATLRFALDKKYDNKSVFSTSVIISFISVLVLMMASPVILRTNSIFGEHWWFFVGIFVTTTFQMTLANYVKGCDKTKIFAIQGVLYTAIFLTLNLFFLLYLKLELQGYFLSMIIAYALSCIYMLVASKCYLDLIPFTFNKSVCKEMLIYSVPMIPTSIAWWINASADKYMILGIVGVGANGLYGVAHKIPTIFSTFSNLFSQAWRISAISTYDEVDKQAYYTRVYKMYSLICIYGCIVLTFASQLIAKILFRTDYYQARVLVPPLVNAALFEAYAGFLASIYAAAKKTKFLSVSTCVGASINIVLNFALIKALGTIGAPIATMLSFVVVWIMRLKVMKSFMPVKIEMSKSIISVTIVIISGLYYAFQGPLKYLAGIVAIIAIVVVNLRDTKSLLGFVQTTIRTVFHKKSGGKTK